MNSEVCVWSINGFEFIHENDGRHLHYIFYERRSVEQI